MEIILYNSIQTKEKQVFLTNPVSWLCETQSVYMNLKLVLRVLQLV